MALSRRELAANEGPLEIPPYSLTQLDKHTRKSVKALRKSDAKRCNTCGKTGREGTMKTCKRCGDTRIFRIFYCSRECQVIDWQDHKEYCGSDHYGPKDFGIPRGPEYAAERSVERAMLASLEALTDIFEWAAKMAHFGLGDPTDTTHADLHIYLRAAAQDRGFDHPFELTSMRLLQSRELCAGDGCTCPVAPDGFKLMRYHVHLDQQGYSRRSIVMLNTFVPLEEASEVEEVIKRLNGCKCIVRGVDFWPWIFAQLVHIRPRTACIALSLRDLLIQRIKDYKRDFPNGKLFAPFEADTIRDEAWSVGTRYQDWSAVMGHIFPWLHAGKSGNRNAIAYCSAP